MLQYYIKLTYLLLSLLFQQRVAEWIEMPFGRQRTCVDPSWIHASTPTNPWNLVSILETGVYMGATLANTIE